MRHEKNPREKLEAPEGFSICYAYVKDLPSFVGIMSSDELEAEWKRGGENAIEVAGIRPSEEIRQELIDSGENVLLAFSGGKDSLCTWLAMLESGMPPERIYPYYLYDMPDIQFVEDMLDEMEQLFQRRIGRWPNPTMYHRLNNGTFQSPERMAVMRAAKLPNFDYPDVIDAIHEDYGLEPNRWKLDGVRAADSIVRRISMKRHGPMKHGTRKVSPIWDWRVSDIRNAIRYHKIPWPIDYEWFGRSFDGIDYRFVEPIARNAPEDFERIKFWYPFVELELHRHDLK